MDYKKEIDELKQQLKEKDEEIEKITNAFNDNSGNKVYIGDFIKVHYDSGDIWCDNICQVALLNNKIIFKVIEGLQPTDGYYDYYDQYIEFEKIDYITQLKSNTKQVCEKAKEELLPYFVCDDKYHEIVVNVLKQIEKNGVNNEQ